MASNDRVIDVNILHSYLAKCNRSLSKKRLKKMMQEAMPSSEKINAEQFYEFMTSFLNKSSSNQNSA